MKRFLSILIFLFICAVSYATHNRAGQVVFEHVPGTLYTYDFIHTQFYWFPSPAWPQRTSLAISFGDGTTGRIIRQDLGTPSHCILLPDSFVKCEYRVRHTFPGPGVYTIVVEDPNRNFGVENIPNSVAVVFSVRTTLRIDPSNTGHNNAPVIQRYPTDKAAVGRLFVHNPSAIHDRDSLSYELVVCTRERGVDIETYSFPEASDTLYVDPVTGDFVWDTPTKIGMYNVAMRIDQWHHRHRHIRVGSIVRDMQIEVVETDNNPPEIEPVDDICVVAGEEVVVEIVALDGEDDYIILTATGYPFQVRENKADTVTILREPGKTILKFTWQTLPSHVRQQPYTIHLKAEDLNPDVRLAAFSQFNITVIAPPIENVVATPDKKEIRLEWQPSECEHASGYEIWRRICLDEQLIQDPAVWCEDFDLEDCDTGIPSEFGYQRVGTVEGHGNTLFRDNDNNRGLSPGITYCYRIVAIFQDGARSKPSVDENGENKDVCEILEAGTPPMIHASVENADKTDGEIFVEWIEYPFLDKLLEDPANYKYRLYFSDNSEVIQNNALWEFIEEFDLYAANGDTVYIHEGIDTKDVFPYYYRIVLFDKDDNPIEELAGLPIENETASTLYPILVPTDRRVNISFGRYAPWVNIEYDIYRCNADGGTCLSNSTFVKINDAPVRGELYIDTGLINDQEYCYQIVSRGIRVIDGVEYRNENWSHIACTTPLDNVPPCLPANFQRSLDCERRVAELSWVYVLDCDEYMDDDLAKFNVYFTSNPDAISYDEFRFLESVDAVAGQTIYNFTHTGVAGGCYFVTSVDKAGNETDLSEAFIMRLCEPCGVLKAGNYEIPNVFTPNGDGINDILIADIKDGACYCNIDGSRNCLSIEGSAVSRVDMQIFNRAGRLVFRTNEPCINWDGKDQSNKQIVPSGVYFYVCDVYEMRNGIEVLTENSPESGFIHVYSDGSSIRQN